MIINEIAKIADIKNIKVIPKTEEQYICYEFEHLKFLDSIAFMPASLDDLVKDLRNGKAYDLTEFKTT